MTFTNKGYVEYTKNLIVSNINNKVNANIRVYALDQYSYDYFQDFHDDVVFHKKQDFENSEELLDLAPSRENKFFKVPKIINE